MSINQGVFQPGSAGSVVSKVELGICARNLVDADVFSKSDPMVVVEQQAPGTTKWHEIGRTETIWDNLNPDWEKKFQMDYHFEVHQMLRFTIYDIDSESRNLENHDFLGQMTCSLGEIVTNQARGQFERGLMDKKGGPFKGKIIVRSEEIIDSRDHFKMVFEVGGLSGGFFSSPKHFLEIRRANEDGNFVLVKRTDHVVGKLVQFPISITGSTLNNGDNQRTLQIELYSFKSNGNHTKIGYFQTVADDLKLGGRRFKFTGGKKEHLTIKSSKVTTKYTFMDYIIGGMEMNFVVGIDFTASNGDPSNPESLHFNHGHYANQYVQAIQSVGDIIQDYDTDKLFPVYGFGARIPPQGQVSHMFPCNFNSSNPFVHGVQGIVDVYKNSISQIQLYGPTNFAPIIAQTASMARQSGPRGGFFVLLIITDGVITDMDATKRTIVENSNLPFSIIIVGVGGADFEKMDELDSDDSLLEWNGKKAKRDIVQFVPYRLFLSDNQLQVKAALAKEVLAEVPDQVTSYMFDNNIIPNNAPPPYAPSNNEVYETPYN